MKRYRKSEREIKRKRERMQETNRKEGRERRNRGKH